MASGTCQVPNKILHSLLISLWHKVILIGIEALDHGGSNAMLTTKTTGALDRIHTLQILLGLRCGEGLKKTIKNEVIIDAYNYSKSNEIVA